MPGSRSASTAASWAAVSITACGAQGTPQATMCAFSTARSWQVATASPEGATGRCAASAAAARRPAGESPHVPLGADGSGADSAWRTMTSSAGLGTS